MLDCHSKGLKQQLGAVQSLVIIKIAIAVLLAVWLVNSLIQFAQLVIPVDAAAHSSPATSDSTLTNSGGADTAFAVDLNALSAIALFGKVVESAPEAQAPVEQETAVETQLNLLLKGLFSTSDGEGGQAIIANGRKEQLYQVGDNIEGLSNVKLLAVLADRIRLDNRGSAEVLYLYPEGERLGSSAPTNQFSPESQLAAPSDRADRGPKNKKLNEIMRVVRERDKTTGDMLGFRVLPGRDREAFEQSGLKVNDVIISMDGEALTDLRTAMGIYRDKRNATAVSLIIRRDGSEISLDIDLNELSNE